ncbi:MAG: hypothetical protein Q8R02_06175 [Hyphomonadaceae bacterium]|nr:hypothetical protein [Hyphomonadaceae bacterium]
MTQARASHLRLVLSEAAPVAVRLPRLRFQPVVRLADGAAFGMHAEADIAFEDTFNPRHLNDASLPSSAAWLGDLIERAGRLAQDAGTTLRPISITAPLAALADRDGPMAAEAGARRANLLPQEFRIEFSDASVTGLEDLALDRVDAFRRKGFRVGLDARKSWRMPMGARARMSFEAVRVDVSRLEQLDIPVTRLEDAAADGVALIAENVRWRDADKLAEKGVHFAVSPRADS